jgi:hypothetical protein
MATTLAAGDIAFTAFQSDNTNGALGGAGGDMFEFVLLKDVTAGTTIYFTDCGFRTDISKFNLTEGLIRWVAKSDLTANTRISLSTSGTTPPTTTDEWTGIHTGFNNLPLAGSTLTAINLALGGSGDSVTAIIGPIDFTTEGFSGTFIASIYWNGSWPQRPRVPRR